MELVTKKVGGVVVLGLAEPGNLDSSNVEDFRKKMTALVEFGTRFVVDMSNITFLDSSGLHTIVAIWRDVAALDGQMKLCRMDPSVRTVFELTGINRVLEIYDTEEEALASIGVGAE